MNSRLYLTLKRQWFDAILAGTKVEEYRVLSPHWQRLLGPHLGHPPWAEIHFRNGYNPDSPFMRVACRGLRLGHDPDDGTPCFVLELGPVLEVINHRSCRPAVTDV